MDKVGILFAMVLFFQVSAQEKPNPETLQPGDKAVDLNLKGVDGKMYSLDSFSDAKVLAIVFSAPHCPTAQAYEERLIDIQNDFGDKGVQMVVINPNHPEAVCLEEMGYSDMGDSFEDMVLQIWRHAAPVSFCCFIGFYYKCYVALHLFYSTLMHGS